MKKLLAILMSICILSIFTACSTSQVESNMSNDNGENIDLDITSLSTTMAYAEVFAIMSNPDEYIGDKVKVCGEFGIYQDPESEQLYYAVIISDETNCCVQGFEFILSDESSYPEVGEQATVIGEFQTYIENDVSYCHLVDAYLV